MSNAGWELYDRERIVGHDFETWDLRREPDEYHLAAAMWYCDIKGYRAVQRHGNYLAFKGGFSYDEALALKEPPGEPPRAAQNVLLYIRRDDPQ